MSPKMSPVRCHPSVAGAWPTCRGQRSGSRGPAKGQRMALPHNRSQGHALRCRRQDRQRYVTPAVFAAGAVTESKISKLQKRVQGTRADRGSAPPIPERTVW